MRLRLAFPVCPVCVAPPACLSACLSTSQSSETHLIVDAVVPLKVANLPGQDVDVDVLWRQDKEVL